MLVELSQTVIEVLSSMGATVKLAKIEKADMHVLESDVGTFLGIITRGRDSKGIFSLEFSSSCANQLLELMMPNMGITFENEIGMSALLELTNMVAGNFVSKFSNELDITTPTGLFGKNVKALLNTVESAVLVFNWQNETFRIKISNA